MATNAQKEIPIDDAELDALMAQLEEETKDVVDAPKAEAAPLVPRDDKEELIDLSELEEDAPFEPTPKATLTAPDDPKDAAALEGVVAAEPDDDLDALAAELDAEAGTAAAEVVQETIAVVEAKLADDDLTSLRPSGTIELSNADIEKIAELIDNPPAPNEKLKAAARRHKERAAISDPDADLAALEAELASATVAPEPTPTITVKPGDAFIAPPGTEVVHLEGAEALDVALKTAEAEAPTPTPAKIAEAPKKKGELNHYIDMDSFRGEIKVSVVTLDDCMMEQASLRAYHGEQAALAERQYAQMKLRFEVVEAKLYDRHRKALAASGEKVTEKMVENAVKLDPEYLAAKMRVIEAETIASVRRACTDALKDRKDMLVQLGADRREEGKGQLRILEAEAAHGNKRALANSMLASKTAA